MSADAPSRLMQELGWLIDGDNRCVYVYRGTAEPRIISELPSIAYEASGREGFIPTPAEIWAGL